MTTLRDRVVAGERLAGVIVRMPCEQLIEMTRLAGLDFVLIDCEHGPADGIALFHHVLAAAPLPVLVRVGQREEILRALDLGADGVVVPHVTSPQQARAAVTAAHYPPRGERGFASYTRAGEHGRLSAAEHHRRSEAHTVVVAMIEDLSGVRDAAAIAGTDGIDAVLVGPADLAVNAGVDADVAALTEQVHRSAAGAARMQIVASPAAARAAFADGAQLVVHNLAQELTNLFDRLAEVPSDGSP